MATDTSKSSELSYMEVVWVFVVKFAAIICAIFILYYSIHFFTVHNILIAYQTPVSIRA